MVIVSKVKEENFTTTQLKFGAVKQLFETLHAMV